MGEKYKKRQKKELSQAEIWDDTALVQSWDDALAEYKKYHSIHARGERVEDAIKTSENNSEHINMAGESVLGVEPNNEAIVTNGEASEELEDGELDEGEAGKPTETVTYGDPQASGNELPSAQDIPGEQQAFPSAPAAMASGINDETLKNLMMSWYYAGYYTGLFEGQQSAANSAMK